MPWNLWGMIHYLIMIALQINSAENLREELIQSFIASISSSLEVGELNLSKRGSKNIYQRVSFMKTSFQLRSKKSI